MTIIEETLAAQRWKVSTKAKTLEQLISRLSSAKVLPIFRLSKAQYDDYTPADLKAVFTNLDTQCLVVRSSFSFEDSASSSMAGMFQSILQVNSTDELKQAIKAVFDSYPDGFENHEEVLIQPMLDKVIHNGVIFTLEQSTGAPYFVISDDASGQTDLVTSGGRGDIDTYYIKRGHAPKQAFLAHLVDLANELIAGFVSNSLDIEYAIDDKNTLWLFQVRPLLSATNNALFENTDAVLHNIHVKVKQSMQPHPFLFGDTTLYGVMPDWNPAEIIGLYPKPLALSLYKTLITDSTWAYQRHNYGYRNLRSLPLMIDFMGVPYIDVRVSFNSFLPKDIAPDLGHKLVNYYLQELKNNPKSHDSVEFDIVLSCYTPSMQSKLDALRVKGFSESECNELSSKLLSLTNKIIDPRTGLWIQDLHRIERLKQRHTQTKAGFCDPVSRIYWLLEDCKRYGTLPFAGLARAAFIAVQLIQSLLENNALSETEYHNFLGSLNTVSSKMQQDLTRLSKDRFLAEYGHLRPGTYDILSPRYDKAPEQYFNWQNIDSLLNGDNTQSVKGHTNASVSKHAYAAINNMLNEHGINHSADSLLHFIKCAIEGREYAKFIFTRNLSDAMEEFVILGELNGFTREQMAFANINIINQLMTGSEDPKNLIRASIEEGIACYKVGQAVKLPTLICSASEVYEFKVTESQPSFITRKAVTGEVSDCAKTDKLKGKIVFITSADPGYDWIFSHGISGFVTAFGGCNSHMAIRAAELNIPAVIGVGEHDFERWGQAELLCLDCESNAVRVIK